MFELIFFLLLLRLDRCSALVPKLFIQDLTIQNDCLPFSLI